MSDLQAINAMLGDMWDSARINPTVLVINPKTYFRMARAIMTKRGFRRMRGRIREERRLYELDIKRLR